MVDPHAVAPHRPQHAREALRAFQFLGQPGGRRQRVQRVAGDDRVERRPQQRRARGQAAGTRASAAGSGRAGRPVAAQARPAAPQPVHAAQHPRVRAQQPGRGQQHEHGRAAPAALELQRQRPQDQREVGDVEVALRGQVLDEEAAQQQQRRDHPHQRAERQPPDAVDPRHRSHERADRPEHHQARAALSEDRAQHPEGDRQRVLGGGAVDLEVGQVRVQQVAAPQQRVEGVVGRVGGERQVPDQGGHAHRPRRRSWPGTRAAPARSAAGLIGPGRTRVGVALSIWPHPHPRAAAR